jgi:RNA polymerase sigma-70 factor (ECF subfamily)
MDQDTLNQRLSRITTIWTLVINAHGSPANDEAAAQQAILERYQGAVYRYLLGAVHDPDTADDLFQEFALRFVRGDFRRADPSQGRFRDYVKKALINLVLNYRKHKQVRDRAVQLENPDALAGHAEMEDLDASFLENWRKELLDRAWAALAAVQQPDGPPYYSVLRFSYEHPRVPSAQVAELLTAQLKPSKPFTGAGVRKTLQRARDKFTDLLVEEVARSIQTTAIDELEQELSELGLLAYCNRALERRRSQG